MDKNSNADSNYIDIGATVSVKQAEKVYLGFDIKVILPKDWRDRTVLVKEGNKGVKKTEDVLILMM